MEITMKKSVLLLLFLFTLISVTASADQLAYLTKDQAEKAVKFLKKQKRVMLFCGCCDNDPKVFVNVKKVYMAPAGYEDYYEIFIEGNAGNKEKLKKAVDLAYVFINKKGTAAAVGLELGMECDPCVHDLKWGEK